MRIAGDGLAPGDRGSDSAEEDSSPLLAENENLVRPLNPIRQSRKGTGSDWRYPV